MAAAYSTGVSTSPTNLLQTFVTWLTGTPGWTLDDSSADGLGWRAHLHKGALYVNLRAAELEQLYPNGAGKFHDSGNEDDPDSDQLAKGWGIGCYLGDGYSGAAAWDMQSGRPIRFGEGAATTIGVGVNLPSGSVAAYHFFDDGTDVTLVVERSAGVVTHLGFGPDMKESRGPETFPFVFGGTDSFQNTNPGPYGSDRAGINVTAWPPMSSGDAGGPSLQEAFPPPARVHPNCLVRVDAATWSARWLANGEFGGGGAYEWGYTGRFLRCSVNANPAEQATPDLNPHEFPNLEFLLGRAYQTAFARALLVPLYCFAELTSGRWAPIGYPASVFYSEAVGNGYALGDVYQEGGLDYMVFPNFAVRKAA